MSLTTKVIIALVAGIAIGLALSASASPWVPTIIGIVEPVGTLFINAIRMTVIPLVFALLIVGIASSADPKVIAQLGGRAVALFVVLLLASGITGAIVAPPILSQVTIDPQATEALRASTAAASGQLAERARTAAPTFSQWLIDLVPANPVKAAADGAMLPLIVFAVALGLSLLVLDPVRRAPVIAFFRGIADAMLVVVRWVLVLAPIGVFALTLPLVARLGFAAVGALLSYIVLVVVASSLFVLLVVYPFAAFAGRIPIGRFARAVLPAQGIAFSARSSLAALPALIEGARSKLGLREEVASFLLPLASATFRTGAAIGLTIGALFIAKLYGMELSPTELATVVLTAVITSFSIPGIPAGSILAMAPVLSSVGLPLEGLGILLGVDTIPDSFRTTANVTGQMAVAAIVGRDSRADAAASPHDGGVAAGELPAPDPREVPAAER